MIRNFLSRAFSRLHPSLVVGGLGDVFSLWQKAGAKEKAVLALVFTPMFICIAGLLLSIVSFVLFVLPSFVLRLLGWGALAMVFGAGGRYSYERILPRISQEHQTTGSGSSASSFSSSSSFSGTRRETVEAAYTDVTFTENDNPSQNGNHEKTRRKK